MLLALGAALGGNACAQDPAAAPAPQELFAPAPIPIKASPSDVEDLDLTEGDPKPRPEECPGSLPSGGAVGAWKAAGSPCPAKLAALSQYPVALAIHMALWCSDPAAAKAAARAAANRRQAEHQAQLDAREEALREAADAQEHAEQSPSMFRSVAIKRDRPAPPPAPYYDPSASSALAWDAKEAEQCKSPQGLAEAGPALSAFAAGKIATPTGSCEAYLIEANMLSGRNALSRVSWISAKCGGYKEPDAMEIATALAQGQAAAQAWQSSHLARWRWEGPAPRDARGRSADAR